MLRCAARRILPVVAAAGLARGFYHLLDRHRVEEAVGCLDGDFRGHGMGSDRAGFRSDVVAWFEAFPDLRISVDRLVGDGDCVAVLLALRGTHQGRFAGVSPTGRSSDARSASEWRRSNSVIPERSRRVSRP